ncbi:C40 family peptidase [Anaeromicropila populeti]|uniref:Cell wall-associated hydrolase, NlpC family n=1 Tax=Anaeromicropila populeti TaxID=37658 RepID=A0A1I6JWW0_9FIRM|nr:C40 family peptidase [Anaeromicropila populeti]SFR83475.1 Cell wall-associated hydrolase, NlpC family [Anaeromicropila populeti]
MKRKNILKIVFCLATPFFINITASASITSFTNTTITSNEGLPINVMSAEAFSQTVVDLTDSFVQISPYANLAVSIAADYVNIRKEPDMEGEIVGKLYEGCAATVELVDDGWVKITSGDVKGYIAKEYLAIGQEAEPLLDEYATKIATVNTQTLKVREKADESSKCLTLVPEGTVYHVLEEKENWVKIEAEGQKGYVAKEYVLLTYEFEYAISIEEEQARIAEEQAAKLAEQQAQLGEQETDVIQTEGGTAIKQTYGEAYSSVGSDIAAYAMQFVGNPYVWGGTSLTNGADCSGFIQSIYRNFGYTIPRTSRQQVYAGSGVSVSQLQAGDLLFYTRNGTVNHVAMYIGGGKVVHASNPEDGIKISNYNYRTIYAVRRIIG